MATFVDPGLVPGLEGKLGEVVDVLHAEKQKETVPEDPSTKEEPKQENIKTVTQAKTDGNVEDGSITAPGLTEIQVESAPISYYVKYKNTKGEVTEIRKPKKPFKLESAITDFPVLEILTTVTPIDSDEIKKEVWDAFRAPMKASPSALSANEADVQPENFKISGTTLRIRSKKLLDALRSVVTYYPKHTLIGDTVSFEEPFQILMHHRDEIEAYKSTNVENHSKKYKKSSSKHIDILLQFLKDHFGKSLVEEEKRHLQDPPLCTFEYVWLFLKPGTSCFLQDEQNMYNNAYNLKAVEGGMVKGRPESYKLSVWNVACDGFELGRVNNTAYILPFGGEKEVKSLTACPVKFRQNEKDIALEKRLIARGERFWNMSKNYSYKEHDGTTPYKPFRQIKGRIVVDFDSYFIQHPNSKPSLQGSYTFGAEDGDETTTGTSGCECETCSQVLGRPRQVRFQDYDNVDPKNEPPNRDDFFLLCWRTVPAFILSERKWVWLDADCIKDVEVQPNLFKYLSLQPGLKPDIEALCRTHMKKKAKKVISTDFIKGKGEGLIFLLHGPPGVGKTATGECIAELLERPLLSLTCSDLGTTAENVASALDNYLTLGETWNAVVVLDEADIYFETRANSDVKRNSLVTVFLRALEYYKGLLFLTTNRVNIFDEAFKSRVHVSLHYRELGVEQQSSIWTNCFERVKKDSIIVTKKAKDYIAEDLALAELAWNGREIQNAFSTAVSLASFDAEDEGNDDPKAIIKVTKSHLKRVIKMSRLFTNYLESVNNGRTARDIAMHQRLRNDNYGQPEPPSKKAQVAAALAAKKKKRGKANKKKLELSSEDDSEDEEEYSETSQSREEESEEDTSEEEEVETQRKKKKANTSTKIIEKTVVKEMRDEEVSEEDEEEEEPPKKRRVKSKKASKKAKSNVEQSDDDGDK